MTAVRVYSTAYVFAERQEIIVTWNSADRLVGKNWYGINSQKCTLFSSFIFAHKLCVSAARGHQQL